MRQFADSGAGVVRHAHGSLSLGYYVGGKVPQRRGHGPRTHTLQRQVHELALGCLVDRGAQQNVFADVLQKVRSFTTVQGVEAYAVTEGIETVLISGEYIGVRLLGAMVVRGFSFPFAVHIPDWNHIIMNTMRNACEAVKCRPRFMQKCAA